MSRSSDNSILQERHKLNVKIREFYLILSVTYARIIFRQTFLIILPCTYTLKISIPSRNFFTLVKLYKVGETIFVTGALASIQVKITLSCSPAVAISVFFLPNRKKKKTDKQRKNIDYVAIKHLEKVMRRRFGYWDTPSVSPFLSVSWP